MPHLRLVSRELFSKQRNVAGEVVDARFLVEVEDAETGTDQIYELDAMTQYAYEAWYLERQTAFKALAEHKAFPLVVPDKLVLVRGLALHVEETYLNPDIPERINEISRFLAGPIAS